MLLNSAAVASSDILKTLVRFLEDHPQAGIIGACLFDFLGQLL